MDNEAPVLSSPPDLDLDPASIPLPWPAIVSPPALVAAHYAHLLTVQAAASDHVMGDIPAPPQGAILSTDFQNLYVPAPEEDVSLATEPIAEFSYWDDFERNRSLEGFVNTWFRRSRLRHSKYPQIRGNYNFLARASQSGSIRKDMLAGDACDFQGLNWQALGTTGAVARQLRAMQYCNYTTTYQSRLDNVIAMTQNAGVFYKFRESLPIHFDDRPSRAHEQLRHNVTATSKFDVYYAATAGQRLLRAEMPGRYDSYGGRNNYQVAMDFVFDEEDPFTISTLTSSEGNEGLLVAGSLQGSYAYKAIHTEYDPMDRPTIGRLSFSQNGITNHVHMCSGRGGVWGTFAVFCSNDSVLRELDCTTNTIISNVRLSMTPNAAATSPDECLRVVVGDANIPCILEARSGTLVTNLKPFRDYAFACAWADDARHFAVAAQDKQVHIYDARNMSQILAKTESDTSCIRSMKFSPMGSGKRNLLMAESGDIITVLDAHDWHTKQQFQFFGEIAGIDYSPTGENFFVSISDVQRGGIMEYERVGWSGKYTQVVTDEWGNERLENYDWASEQEMRQDKRRLRTSEQRLYTETLQKIII